MNTIGKSALVLAAVIGVGAPAATLAEEASPPAPPEKPAGILPIPEYSGRLWDRSHLTGDWWGARTDLAERGIQFEVDWTQTVQSVVDGGRDRGTEYNGSLDYLLNVDLDRMGVMRGGLLKVRAESKYGDSVNGTAGPLLPVNTDALFPLTSPGDEDIAIAVTNLSYIQFLSEKLGVLVGKVDTLDGDLNEFAAGRGTSQFLNSNFIFSPTTALVVPYSTLAAGILWLPSPNVTVTSTVFNTDDSSTTTGFSDFGHGTTWSTEAQFQYRIANRPGGINGGFIYAFDSDFREIGSGRLVFRRGRGLSVESDTDDDTAIAYASAWQYLWTEGEAKSPCNLADGRPDHEGVGVFARLSVSDGDENPVDWSGSLGVGGRGVIPTRDRDSFGLGYFYARLQSTRFLRRADVDDESRGFEAYYSIALTPAAHLTLDAQVVDAPFPNVDTAAVLGARLHLEF